MPRVKLGSNFVNPVKRREKFNRLVAVGMAREGIETKEKLASLMGMARPCLSKRWSGETAWTYDELCRLFQILRFSPEEMAQAMGAVA